MSEVLKKGLTGIVTLKVVKRLQANKLVKELKTFPNGTLFTIEGDRQTLIVLDDGWRERLLDLKTDVFIVRQRGGIKWEK
jgi:hypothetical protein